MKCGVPDPCRTISHMVNLIIRISMTFRARRGRILLIPSFIIYIIEIMVFPLDNNFSFWWYFFFLGDIFFFGFRHRFQVYRGSSAARRGARRARGAERRAERGAKRRTEPGAEPRGPGGLLAVPPTTPGKLETDGESQQKKILSQDKKNTHQQTKILIQRKHQYAYDIVFFC